MKLWLPTLVFLYGSLWANASVAWRPDDRLLDALCQIESSGGKFLSGDGGSSLGYFQMQQAAWTDVLKWRKQRNLPLHDYRSNVLDPEISRVYAADYLAILHTHLKGQYKREPTSGELYAAYNMGLTGFRKCNYDLAKVNATTRKKCQEIMALASAVETSSYASQGS